MAFDRTGAPLNDIRTAVGWTAGFLSQPTPLTGSNGLRIGPDGALYVAQAFSGCIGKVDPSDGSVAILPASGELIGPDDLAFDSRGNLFITEVMAGRVSMRQPDGSLRTIADDTPAANGITVHDDRIFMSEFNPEGRILELSPDGAAPRTIASGLMMPNALQLGPDGLLYFPLVPLGEIWRVSLDGNGLERVTGGLAMPTAVKFDAAGRLWALEAATGGVRRIDIGTGAHVEALQTASGADNLVFLPDGGMFVSHFTDGEIVEVSPGGGLRELVAPGLLGPFGIAVDAAGQLIIADGGSIASLSPSGRLRRIATMLQPGAPGHARGIAIARDGSLLITNTAGQLARFRPDGESEFLASDLDQAMGCAADRSDGAYVCEAGAGRLLAISATGEVRVLLRGLDRPSDVHHLADDTLIVSETGAGRVLHVRCGEATTIINGLVAPHGVTATADGVFVLDYDSAELHLLSARNREVQTVASDLPVGNFCGRRAEGLPGIRAMLPGPILPFGGLAASPDGSVLIAADALGAVAKVQRDPKDIA